MLECGCLSANVAPPLLVSRLMICLKTKIGICQALLVHVVVRFIFYFSGYGFTGRVGFYLGSSSHMQALCLQ